MHQHPATEPSLRDRRTVDPTAHAWPRHHNITVMGDGPLTLLLVHGYGCNQAMWRSVAPALAQRWRVVLLDLVGFGGSDVAAWDAQRHGTLEGHAQDLLAVAAAFADRPLVVVGHSVGATIGLLAEQADPAMFAAHAMVAPSPSFQNDGDYRGGFARETLEGLLAAQDEDMAAWAGMVAAMVMAQPPGGALAAELAQSICAAHPPAARSLAHATFLGDHRDALRALRKPTLVLQSAHDELAPIGIGHYITTRVPSSRLHILDMTGHCPHLTAPDECIAALRLFLLEVEGDLAACGRAPLP